MGYGDRDRGRGRQDDGKYVRLTGLWENRNKRGMFTGKIRNQDIQKIMRKFEECDDKRSDVVVFLWENNNKRDQKDPDFTVQIAEAEDRGGRGGYSNNNRDQERDQDRDKRDDDGGSGDRNRRSRSSSSGVKDKAPAKGKGKKEDDW